jgi:hypothetical protein
MPRSQEIAGIQRAVTEAAVESAQQNETAPSSAETPLHDVVARRAYDRWQERGGAHGRDQEDWFVAEHELTSSDQS